MSVKEKFWDYVCKKLFDEFKEHPSKWKKREIDPVRLDKIRERISLNAKKLEVKDERYHNFDGIAYSTFYRIFQQGIKHNVSKRITKAFAIYTGFPSFENWEAQQIGDITNGISPLPNLKSEQERSNWLLSKIEEHNLIYFNQRNHRHPTPFYWNDIPFRLSTRKTKKYKLYSYLNFKLDRRTKRKAVRYCLISEFGYGKTYLLLKIANEWKSKGRAAFFIPMAQLPKTAFQDPDNLSNSLLHLLLKQTLSNEHPAMKMDEKFNWVSKRLQEDIKEQRIVLLLDGWEEHYKLYHIEWLQDALTTLRDLRASFIISLQQNYWTDRSRELQSQLFSPLQTNIVYLCDWEIAQISAYLNQHIQLAQSPDRRQRLKNLLFEIESNQLDHRYQDLLHRPIFLSMLTRDTIHEQTNNVLALYQRFIEEKFERDINTAFQNSRYRKFFTIMKREGQQSVLRFLHRLFKAIAIQLLRPLPNGLQLNPYIGEDQLSRLLDEQQLKIDLSDLPQFSILQYHSTINDISIRYRFAHKSFQSYYTAYALLDFISSPTLQNLDYLTLPLPNSTQLFLLDLLQNNRTSPINQWEEIDSNSIKKGSALALYKKVTSTSN